MTTARNELTTVELPLIQQLQGIGWDYKEGDRDVPYLTERETFRQVLLTDRLSRAIHRINLDEDGQVDFIPTIPGRPSPLRSAAHHCNPLSLDSAPELKTAP